MTAKVIGISLPNYIMENIDKQRGDIPRSKYILRMIEKHFKEIENNGD